MCEQCKSCIHSSVCGYREYYENAAKVYEKARTDLNEYPCFKVRIECCYYHKISVVKERGL